jgi:hypothetical protein
MSLWFALCKPEPKAAMLLNRIKKPKPILGNLTISKSLRANYCIDLLGLGSTSKPSAASGSAPTSGTIKNNSTTNQLLQSTVGAKSSGCEVKLCARPRYSYSVFLILSNRRSRQSYSGARKLRKSNTTTRALLRRRDSIIKFRLHSLSKIFRIKKRTLHRSFPHCSSHDCRIFLSFALLWENTCKFNNSVTPA